MGVKGGSGNRVKIRWDEFGVIGVVEWARAKSEWGKVGVRWGGLQGWNENRVECRLQKWGERGVE